MAITSFRKTRWVLIEAVCLAVGAMSGCAESNFRIASDSRLPQGMVIPPGLTRADVSATVDFYTLGKVKLTLRDKSKRKIGAVIGHQMGNPVYSKTSLQGFEPGYPAYVLIVIDGQIEIIEYKHPGDVANITDSPDIRKELLAGRGVQ